MLILALKGVKKRYASTFIFIFYFAIFLGFMFLLEFHRRSKFSSISENTFPDFTLCFHQKICSILPQNIKKQKQQKKKKRKEKEISTREAID